MEAITYAKVGGPPAFWSDLKVVDQDSGAEVRHVLEVNTIEGWVLRTRHDLDGRVLHQGGEILTERLYGRFVISVMT